jgi:transcriptional regulator with XRE-family HTH domain
MNIFEFVSQHRKALGLTQKQLADKSDVTLSVVKRFEAKRPYNLNILKVIKVAKALQVTPQELLDCDGFE